MSLNKDLPHGEVFGVAGVKWEQAGRLYDVMERQVTIQNDMAVLVPVEQKAAKPEEDGSMTEAELREFARISGIKGADKLSIAALRKELGA